MKFKNLYLSTTVLILSLLVLSGSANAQYEFKVQEVKAVTGLSNINRVGNVLVVDEDSDPKFKDVVILYVDSDDVDVEVELLDRTPVAINPVGPNENGVVAYVFDEPGTYFVTMEQLIIDEDRVKRIKRIKRRAKIEVKNYQPVLPDNVDPSQYQDVIERVMPLINQMSDNDRRKCESIMVQASNKMKSFEFKSMNDVGTYIASNRPKDNLTNQVFKILSDEAKSRPPLSRPDTQLHFQIIAALFHVS